ncbi:NUDIX hydrolase [Corynebacterium pelargi]|uniref:Putative NUDIX hydrolase n=1 Tax=Corynebacterium pelargi TaxID=1471400 RepID=A0A410WBF5_9CORY|nr:CoA pyrophosphatase [Corynebacterium pelargi]QAU53298.1 putative NUDIX hydrolase [Corynebacterium pelargi]GGG73456.1 NTP pyrophosphohydrolase [Corynebacterium pelargi]
MNPDASPLAKLSPDSPGENITLQPERAPLWMRGLVRDVDQGHLDARLRKALKPDAAIDHRREASVLILLAGTETSAELPHDAAVLLTHRSPRLRSHSGQMAFPGGRRDPEDINAVDCALREAWEETGLDRHSLSPLAQLPEVHIRATGYPVHPVLAHWHSPSPVGVVDPGEADAVASVPLAELLAPENRLTVARGGWHGPAFRLNGFIIWGFTGGLLDAIITQAGWEQEWDRDRHYDLVETLARSRNKEAVGDQLTERKPTA